MTDAPPLIVPPPTPRMFDYPGLATVLFITVFTTALVAVAGRFDPTMGVLTISLIVVLAFTGTVVFCLFFSVPNDEVTASVLGGLTAAFGAVVAHWLGRSREPPK
jgi:uncharacterized BrkB/YihY/UPF0761 family membrane protein